MNGSVADVAVYVIHWDAPTWCANAVRSLLASAGVTIEVCVVDNGQRSGEPLRSLMPESVRIIQAGRNRGYAGAANIALDDWARTTSGVCVIASHDAHVTRTTLYELRRAMLREPAFGVLGPCIEGRDEPTGEPGSVVERDWISGQCMMIRRSCAADVGAFDERIGSYTEDVDYCWRAGDHGWLRGVVVGTRSWGLGSSSADAQYLRLAHGVVLGAKRGGLRSLIFGVARLLVQLSGAVARSALAPSPDVRARYSDSRRNRLRALRRIAQVYRQHGFRWRPGSERIQWPG